MHPLTFHIICMHFNYILIELVILSNHLFLYHSLRLIISPSNESSGLISLRTDWFDLLAVQGTLKSLLQHYSLKVSILWCSAFFMAQLSHPYMTTGKTITLTVQIFVAKWCFCFLAHYVCHSFPSKNKRLSISLLQSPFWQILEPKKIKFATVSTFSPSICHEVMGPDAVIFIFWMLSFKQTFSLSSFTFIKSFSSFSAITKVVSPAYLRLLIFLRSILIPTCDSSSLAFC